MNRKIGLLVVINVLILSITTFAKKIENDNCKKVLQIGSVDSLFVFGKWSQNGTIETHLMYLGKVKTNSGRTFKVVNSSMFWGISKRATNRILLFDEWNHYVGNYKIDTQEELPTKLDYGHLIFKNSNNECDKNTITKIDLSKGLPKKFFRKCNNNNGDFFVFESE